MRIHGSAFSFDQHFCSRGVLRYRDIVISWNEKNRWFYAFGTKLAIQIIDQAFCYVILVCASRIRKVARNYEECAVELEFAWNSIDDSANLFG